MKSIPLNTRPLAKAIRTSEGILVYLVNLLLGLGTVIDPSRLPPDVAAKWIAVLSVAHVVSRSLLKALTAQAAIGIAPPIDPQPLVDDLVVEISAHYPQLAAPAAELEKLIIDVVHKGQT